VSVDVALPSGAPVIEWLPDLVDLLDGHAGSAYRWRLDHPISGTLEESLSLADNGIRNGDLLVLSQESAPRMGGSAPEPCREVITARPPTTRVGGFPPGAACVLLTACASLALAATAGTGSAVASVIVAAVGALAAAALTVASGYPPATGLGAVGLAAATGFVAVPSPPTTPNGFLAATAALCASLLLWRLSGRDSATLVAAAAFSLPVVVATVVPMPGSAAGATLTITSLILLAVAPRIALATASGCAGASHGILDGLVAGTALGSGAGTVVVAVADHPAGPYSAIAFAAVTGTALALVARTHVDPVRRIALGSAGLAAILGGLWLVCDTHPQTVPVVAGGLIVLGLAATRPPPIGETVGRLLDRLEYAALAAAIPVACWVAGTGALVGGFHLP
jgi:hypothetical protein